MIHSNFTIMALSSTEPQLLTIEKFYTALFWSCDFDLTTFIYELDPHLLKMYIVPENELSTSRLSQVIIRHTDIQTDATEHLTTPLCGW